MVACDGKEKAKEQQSLPKDTVESWHEKDQRISVTEGNGFLYTLQLQAKVNSPPADIYDILTDPNTVSIFRSIKECTYRNILEEDGKGRRKLEVGHRAIARFLFLSVSFETHLHVWEDDVARTVRFQTAREQGLLKKFDGMWRIQPFTQETLDGWFHPERHHHHLLQHNPFSALPFFHKPVVTDSLVTLEQSLLPRGPSPPGLRGVVRGLCAAQIRNMMEDLNKELDRRKNGSSDILAEREQRRLQHQQHVAAKAACISLARPIMWDQAAPISITIQL